MRDHMSVVRLLVVVIVLGLAMLCGGAAGLVYHCNYPTKDWLFGGPLDVCGCTVSPTAAIAGLASLAMVLLFLAAYVCLAGKSDA